MALNRLARWSIMGRKDYDEALITVWALALHPCLLLFQALKVRRLRLLILEF